MKGERYFLFFWFREAPLLVLASEAAVFGGEGIRRIVEKSERDSSGDRLKLAEIDNWRHSGDTLD